MKMKSSSRAKWGSHPEQSEGQKIFESWETIALYSPIIRGVKTEGKSSETNSIWHVNFLLRILNGQHQTTFTMESLILAQDER